jgi:uncharacterized RDD family membrane protein YckC
MGVIKQPDTFQKNNQPDLKAVPQVPPHATFQTATTATYAPSNKNKRFVAFIIDGLIAGVFTKVLETFVTRGFNFNPTAASLFTYALVIVFYWVGLTLLMGATPGKKIMGLRIVRVDHSLDVGIGQLLFRESMGRIISTLPFCLGYVWISWDKERKTFHDMLSKTRVVDYR